MGAAPIYLMQIGNARIKRPPVWTRLYFNLANRFYLQAQALLKSSEAYLKLDEAMHHVQYFRTNLHTLLIGSDSDSVEVRIIITTLV